MDIIKVFAELGRMHLEVLQLQQQLADAQAKLAQYAAAEAKTPAPSKPE
jgi:cell division protein FtsB